MQRKTHTQTDIQAGRQTDRQTDRADREVGRVLSDLARVTPRELTRAATITELP